MPDEFSWITRCEAAYGASSMYDLQMRVCRGVADPLAINTGRYASLQEQLTRCPAQLPIEHAYRSAAYQSILELPFTPEPGIVAEQLVEHINPYSGYMQQYCIAEECVMEAAKGSAYEVQAAYQTMYVTVLVFYILTLAESIEFVKPFSLVWYVRVRLALGLLCFGEVVAFLAATVQIFDYSFGSCWPDLDHPIPAGEVYNRISVNSTAMRCIALFIFSVCYILARCCGAVEEEGAPKMEVHEHKAPTKAGLEEPVQPQEVVVEAAKDVETAP